jgi:hypothetical protein
MDMRRLLWLIIILLVLACNKRPQVSGTLAGHVTIGPLVPVSRAGVPDPTPAPGVYAARKIVIYAPDGQTEITRVDIDAEGNYEVALPVGTYVVDINRLGIDHGIDLPAMVEILGLQLTLLDIDIDTGIR